MCQGHEFGLLCTVNTCVERSNPVLIGFQKPVA
jgi:hypothetical protein